MADLNGDGHVDVLSGSWPGEIFWFHGLGKGIFAAPRMLHGKDGKPINIGGGIQEQPDGSYLVYGTATEEETEEGTWIVYQGERVLSTPEKPVYMTGTASAIHAVDWDRDQDLDLLVGDIQGRVHLVENEGARFAPTFGAIRQLEADFLPLAVEGDAGPFVADWDGDGDEDLLVGAGDGSVTLFRMESDGVLGEGVHLLPPAPQGDLSEEPSRGIRAKVCAADWDDDGDLDLLVGDYATQKPKLPEYTDADQAEHARVREELAPIEERYHELVEQLYGEAKGLSKAEAEKLQAELEQVRERVEALRGKLPPEYENHGWVWLFRREAR